MERRTLTTEPAAGYDGFLETVADLAHTDRDPAERATRATLQTLAERIARGEAQQLAARLPSELAPFLATDGPAERFDVDEFIRRVAERAGTDAGTAERHARAVFAALSRVVGDEYGDMVAQLPSDFARLLPKGRDVDVQPLDAFLSEVAERADLDRDGARSAADAVLEALAERIAGGEVDDLVLRLPVELHEPLRRGKERSGGQATRMPATKFVRRVAELEGTDEAHAVRHTGAVFGALRATLPQNEFLDIDAQLPDDYDPLLGRG